MSRRRGEFEHRTSLFEGAYRAWSHLGGLDPVDLFSKSPEELDPLNMSTEPVTASFKTESTKDDASTDAAETQSGAGTPTGEGDRAYAVSEADEESLSKKGKGDPAKKSSTSTPTNPNRRDWRYEPLPRSGLEHPYVRSIITPWLGPDSEDPDEVEQGLATLRNWWQHRRKGESRSAISALGTVKMRALVDGYTRHFFRLALDLVRRDKAHPPKTLLANMGCPKSERNRRNKPKHKNGHSEDEEEVGEIMTSLAGARSLEGGSGASSSLLSGLPLLGGLDVLAGVGGSFPGSAASLNNLKLSFSAGLGTPGGLSVDHSKQTLDLLLQQHRQTALDQIELTQLARSRQLMAATSILSPLEQLHLLQRERQLALLGTAYSVPNATNSLSQGFGDLRHYSPPNWLLEPLERKPNDTTSEETA
ncbi:hypothetical protein IV203_013159 [Nitzschia inconspicua]|uniref:Uncharacterized protein n=1 Tax=Nitzschia inconspicua TaxID=303405 RepID=A0A9K3M588_9STRA|nr:hypothetical protein IV203_013159 [Nitzschia inconspicua]